MRNIERVYYGTDWEIVPWYFSPYKVKEGSSIVVCDRCLEYFQSKKVGARHIKGCQTRTPPGSIIYHDTAPFGEESKSTLSVYIVDGASQQEYCVRLWLLAKLFLDHKTLFLNPHMFNFFILTEDDGEESRLLGYFSQEKVTASFNLNCILVLP